METDIMTYLPETMPAIERLGIAVDEIELAPPPQDTDDDPGIPDDRARS